MPDDATAAEFDAPTVRLVARAANEGIPIAAIARIFQHPYDVISEVLDIALSVGRIGTKPKPDWPPTARWSDRLPSSPRYANVEDVEFRCKKLLGLTQLEVGFMVVLLRHEHVEKERLHYVIEEQRQRRQQRLNSADPTDPKMVDVIICKLRKKLSNAGYTLRTAWGKGYYFEPEMKQKIFERIGAAAWTNP